MRESLVFAARQVDRRRREKRQPVPVARNATAPATTPEAANVQDEWPPAKGWHFRSGQYAYDGDPHNMTGAELRLLKHLASNLKSPFALGELKIAVCGNRSPTSETSMRPLLTKLRDKLRTNHDLPADSDPIPRAGRGQGAVWWLDMTNRKGAAESDKEGQAP